MFDSLRPHGLSMEFSRQEHWSGLLFPSPGDLPDSGIETGSPALQADSLPCELPGKPMWVKGDFSKGKETIALEWEIQQNQQLFIQHQIM